VARAIAETSGVDIVINGAAYTAVDKAESEPDLAHRINAGSVAALAEACAKRDVPVLHLSTDYVFDGTKPAPYVETDATNPLNVYGRTKLAGEIALRAAQPEHLILRTSWVYSAFGANFVKTMLRLGAEREELRIVDDQIGAPTAAGEIAAACLVLAERVGAGPEPAWGTYHLTASGETSWFGFARAIFDIAAPWAGLKARLAPIPTSAYPTPARRPTNSRLDCSKLAHAFGLSLRPWREPLIEVLAELKAAKAKAS
jgi:dTDP-4-dehydrorhamnose reductase